MSLTSACSARVRSRRENRFRSARGTDLERNSRSSEITRGKSKCRDSRQTTERERETRDRRTKVEASKGNSATGKAEDLGRKRGEKAESRGKRYFAAPTTLLRRQVSARARARAPVMSTTRYPGLKPARTLPLSYFRAVREIKRERDARFFTSVLRGLSSCARKEKAPRARARATSFSRVSTFTNGCLRARARIFPAKPPPTRQTRKPRRHRVKASP